MFFSFEGQGEISLKDKHNKNFQGRFRRVAINVDQNGEWRAAKDELRASFPTIQKSCTLVGAGDVCLLLVQ